MSPVKPDFRPCHFVLTTWVPSSPVVRNGVKEERGPRGTTARGLPLTASAA